MGLTEGHWFEDEEPELTEDQLEDILWKYDKISERAYQKGFSDGKSAALSEQEPVAPLHKCFGCFDSYTLVTNKYFLFCPYCGKKVKWDD